MSTNLIFEVQKIIIQSLGKIDFLKNNEIVIYSSVSRFAKLPYLKIKSMDISSDDSIGSKRNIIDFNISIIANGKTSKPIMEIIEAISSALPDIIFTIPSNSVKILNLLDMKFSISEQNPEILWNGEILLKILVEKKI